MVRIGGILIWNIDKIFLDILSCLDEKFPENSDMVNETDSNELWKREFQFDNKMEIFITRISSYKIATDINSFKLGRKSFLNLEFSIRIHFEMFD